MRFVLAAVLLGLLGCASVAPTVTLPATPTSEPNPIANGEMAQPSPSPRSTEIRTAVAPATAVSPERHYTATSTFETDHVTTLPAPIASLAADPQDVRAAYALLINHTLYRTTDRGAHWERLAFPAPLVDAPALPNNPNNVFIVPQNDIRITTVAPGLLFVRAGETLYRSDDRGVTWRMVQDRVTAWTIEESEALWMFVWRDADLPHDQVGLYRSQDRGETWQQIYTGFFPPFSQRESFMPNHQGITSLAMDYSVPSILYAGTDFGIYRSLNGGSTWQEFNRGLPPTNHTYRWVPLLSSQYGATLAVTGVSPSSLSERDLIAKLQHGKIIPDQDEWREIGTATLSEHLDLSQDPIQTIVHDPILYERFYLGTTRGLFLSNDDGETWQRVELDTGAVYRIAAAYSTPSFLYLWTDRGLVVTPLPLASPSAPTLEAPRVTLTPIAQLGGRARAMAVRDQLAYIAVGARLVVADISNPQEPRLLGESDILPGVGKIILKDEYAFLAAGRAGIVVVNVKDAKQPRLVRAIPTAHPARAIQRRGNTAIVAEGDLTGSLCCGALSAYDVSIPDAPRALGTLELAGSAWDMALAGAYAYVIRTNGLDVIDVGNPSQLKQIASLPEGGYALVVHGEYAYLGQDYRLAVLALSNPRQPRVIAGYEKIGAAINALVAQDETLYASTAYCDVGVCFGGVLRFDVSEPTQPRPIATGLGDGIPADLAAVNNHTFVLGENRLSIFDLARPNEPHRTAALDFFGDVYELAFAGDRLVTTDAVHALKIIGLDDPSNPEPVSFVKLEQEDFRLRSATSALTVSNEYSYVGMWEDGLRVISLAKMDRPQIVASLAISAEVRAMQARGDALYAASTQGLRILDVNTPGSPRLVGSFDVYGDSTDLAVRDEYAYLVGSSDALGDYKPYLYVLNVHDSRQPKRVGAVTLSRAAHSIALADEFAYVTMQGCDSSPCAGGLSVVDVSDPTAPQLTSTIDLPAGAGALVLDSKTSMSQMDKTGFGFLTFVIQQSRARSDIWKCPVA